MYFIFNYYLILKKSGKGLSQINWDKLLLSKYDDCQTLPIENVDEYKVFKLLDIHEKIIKPYNLKFTSINKKKLEKLKQKKYYLCKKKI